MRWLLIIFGIAIASCHDDYISPSRYQIPISKIISLRNSSKEEIDTFLKGTLIVYQGLKQQQEQSCHIWGYLSPPESDLPEVVRIDLCESGLSYLVTNSSFFWSCVNEMEAMGIREISERRKPDGSFSKYFKSNNEDVGVVVWARSEKVGKMSVEAYSFFILDTIGVNNLIAIEWP